jgi:two-component system LytT family response regulator
MRQLADPGFLLSMANTVHTVILENDAMSQMQLEYFCSNIPEITLLKNFDNSEEAISYLKATQPDLLFLDIELNDGQGWQVLDHLTPATQVVVTTSHDGHIEKARTEYGIQHVLKKPIRLNEFLHEMNGLVKR